MSELWRDLIPLVLASAVLPGPLVVTLLLLRSSARITGAWLAGMTAVRLVQGALFGLVLSRSTSAVTETPAGRDAVVAAVLLVLGVALLVAGARLLLGADDGDDPPPRWMSTIESVRAGRAFVLGAGFVSVSAKLWVFTLAALAAIEDAQAGRRASVTSYLAFVALAIAPQLVALAFAVVAPARAHVLLGRVADRLRRHNRTVMIAVSLVFGTWFLVKALRGFGIL